MMLDLDMLSEKIASGLRAPEEYLTEKEEAELLYNVCPDIIAELREARKVIEIAKVWKQARIKAAQTLNGTWKPEYHKAELDFWVALAEWEGKK